MSRKRKSNSSKPRSPQEAALKKLRREAARAVALASKDPSNHEKATRAWTALLALRMFSPGPEPVTPENVEEPT